MKYFADTEFVRVDLLRPQMSWKLDQLREEFGAPLVVASSYRESEKNVAVGGAPTSAHLASPTDGLYSGVDLTTVRNRVSASEMFRLVLGALQVGFTRIGVYPDHLHVDVEPHLPPRVLWVGS